MRILHTADWHLGKRLNTFSRLEEQKQVLDEISAIAERENVDAVIVAGDLFDTFNPPVEAVDLFYQSLKKLTSNGTRAVIAIAGNHDSPERIEAPDPLARECGIIFSGFPFTQVPNFVLSTGIEVLHSEPGFIELKTPRSEIPLRLLLTPYANEQRMKTFLGIEDSEEELRKMLSDRWNDIASQRCDTQGINILIAHLFFMQDGGEKPEEPEDEKPITHVGNAQAIYSSGIPEELQYVALGHLHKMQIIDTQPCPVVYSGSPLSYSFSEAGQEKYVLILDCEPSKDVTIKQVPLLSGRKLSRCRFDDIDKAVQWLTQNPHDLVELTIVSDTYLTADDRRKLLSAHNYIVHIIPEVTHAARVVETSKANIDITKSMEEQFVEYFKYKNQGQEPDEGILNLFKEVMAEEEDEK